MTAGSIETASGLAAAAVAWRDADPDPATRAELDQLITSGDTAALAERFEGEPAFGTAGIRAEIGAGPMRMNRLVIARVATGLAQYIKTRDDVSGRKTRDQAAAAAGVVIGYDGRTNSAVFATDAARILSRAGISTSLLPRPLPTPVLAFAVRHLHAAYGVMVTASHNPRQYNGLKVYVRDGGQLLPPADAEIAAAIDAVDPLHLPEGWAEGPFAFRPADEAADAYVAAVAARGHPAAGSRRLTVVHTALHAWETRRCGPCWPRPAGRHRYRSPPSSSPIPPSRPRTTRTPKSRGCSTWPGRPPNRPAPTWCWPTILTPTVWPSWCLVPAAGRCSRGTRWRRCWATRY